MSRQKSKIPAFSLLETLVVLVLSSIVVGIIYTMYYTVSSYHIQLMRKQRAMEDISTVYFLLKKDVAKSRTLVATDAWSVTCRLENGNDIGYTFDSLYILRNQHERADTFFLLSEIPAFYFNTQKVDKYPETIDAVEIAVKNMALPLNIHIFKQYDAASLINLSYKDSIQ
jgi:hypothetical protein